MTVIKELRKASDVSQVELAQAIGVTQGAVSRWESGDVKPTIDKLVAIARFFGCKVDDLIDK